MKYTRLLAVLFLIVCSQNVFARNQTGEQQRIERLVGLAKVWGAVKFFHPYMAYRPIDWDKALIDEIPKVNAAKNPQEYAAAVNAMLAALNDKNTRAEIPSTAKPNSAANTGAAKEPFKFENGVLTVDVTEIARQGMKDQKALGETIQKLTAMLPQAKSLILDVRGRGITAEDEAGYIGYFIGGILTDALPLMLDQNITLGTNRYRMHNGYAPQTGATSGGYYSAFVTDAPITIEGRSKTKMPPAVFITDDKTPPIAVVLSGLQSAGKAFVVQDGELTEESGILTYEMKLPDNVTVKMRTTELVAPDGSVGFQADSVVAKTDVADAAMTEAVKRAAQTDFKRTAINNQATMTLQPAKDKTYAEMEFPAAEYRLLALFRYWNVINYFYPYKDLMDTPWSEVLPKYVPLFEANKDAGEYQLTVQQMVAETDDSHSGVRFPTLSKSGEKLGRFFPPLAVKFIENQTVVTGTLDANTGIEKGDAILTVDGEPIEKRRERFAAYTAASTNQALQRVFHFNLLRGQKDTKMKMTVRGLDGKTREVELTRSVAYNDPRWQTLDSGERKTPKVAVLPSGFGYADLARLEVGEVDNMFETLKSAPAIIFDMRGYPKGTAWSIAPRLTEKNNVPAALFTRPFLTATILTDADTLNGANYAFTQYLPERKGDAYKGKIVMLIDENAISQSEHTCMFFEAARPDITFIGMPTMGANGDVTTLTLPGNLIVGFTGHNVRHADGRQLQRIGIQPTIRVAPTIRGTLDGKDEILDAAVNFLQQGGK